jgi:hypothetical protein
MPVKSPLLLTSIGAGTGEMTEGSNMSSELYLRILRRQEPGEGTVLVLAGSTMLNMAEDAVAVLGHPLSKEDQKILAQAKIDFQMDVSTDPVHWQLCCHNEAWICSVNDARLVCGESLTINPGDQIEVGLLRFKVIHASEAALFSQQEPLVSDGPENPDDTFDLGKLSEVRGWQAPGSRENPFDIVGTHIPHLDEQTPPSALPDDMEGLAEPINEDDILSRLAGEYARVIHDPEHLHKQYWGEEAPDVVDLTVPSPSDLHQGWDARLSLEDIVSGQLSLQDILDNLGIDDFQSLEITEPSPSDEVLSMFAQGVLSGGRDQSGWPAIARHEHHRVSLDSHYQPEEKNSDDFSLNTLNRGEQSQP